MKKAIVFLLATMLVATPAIAGHNHDRGGGRAEAEASVVRMAIAVGGALVAIPVLGWVAGRFVPTPEERVRLEAKKKILSSSAMEGRVDKRVKAYKDKEIDRIIENLLR